MGIRTIIPGPPGTGKTFRLVNHYLDKEIKEYKTDPQKIIYITYSNAGVNEAAKRINHNLLYVSTMHHLGTKELKINPSKRLLKGKRKWQIFSLTVWMLLIMPSIWQSVVKRTGNSSILFSPIWI